VGYRTAGSGEEQHPIELQVIVGYRTAGRGEWGGAAIYSSRQGKDDGMTSKLASVTENGAVLWMTDIRRVGQNHVYTVYVRYFWQGNHQIYGYIWCIYTALANPRHAASITFVGCGCACEVMVQTIAYRQGVVGKMQQAPYP
jgi:hypothetical protein